MEKLHLYSLQYEIVYTPNVQCKYRKLFHLTASHFSIDKFTWAITTAFSVLQHRFSRVSVSVQITQFITQFCEHNTNSATLPWCCVPFSILFSMFKLYLIVLVSSKQISHWKKKPIKFIGTVKSKQTNLWC